MILSYNYRRILIFYEMHLEEQSQIQRDQARRYLCLKDIVRTLRKRVLNDQALRLSNVNSTYNRFFALFLNFVAPSIGIYPVTGGIQNYDSPVFNYSPIPISIPSKYIVTNLSSSVLIDYHQKLPFCHTTTIDIFTLT